MSALATIGGKLATKFGIGDNTSEVLDILKNTAFKSSNPVTDAQLTALMIVANEYGLNPWTKEIYAYPDKTAGIVPVVGVDGWLRIINEQKTLQGIEFVYSEETLTFKGKKVHEWIECLIYRSDRAKPTIIREYFDEVSRELNYANPWNSHPKRMHRHKVLIQCARVAFGFSGIYDQDEAERIVEVDIQTGERTTKTASQKQEAVVAEEVFYPQENFIKNSVAWKNAFESGKQSKEQIIERAEGKGKLTDEQKQVISSWVMPEADNNAETDNWAE